MTEDGWRELQLALLEIIDKLEGQCEDMGFGGCQMEVSVYSRADDHGVWAVVPSTETKH